MYTNRKVNVLHVYPLVKYLSYDSLPFTLHFNEISKMLSFIRPTLCSSKHEKRNNLLYVSNVWHKLIKDSSYL